MSDASSQEERLLPDFRELSFGDCENQSSLAVNSHLVVNSPLTQSVVIGEFLPQKTPFSTTSKRMVRPSVLQPSNTETVSYHSPVGVLPHGSLEKRSPRFLDAPSYSERQTIYPAMQVQNYNLFQYRRMMINSPSANPHELEGHWRGINKGLATVAIDEQFIKHFQSVNGQVYGDNISVAQVPLNQVHQNGWQPRLNPSTGTLSRQGKFKVMEAKGIGAFRHGLVLSYRDGGNSKRDPARLIEDRLVKLDDNHMLGRATVRLGPIRIPLAYFVLERAN